MVASAWSYEATLSPEELLAEKEVFPVVERVLKWATDQSRIDGIDPERSLEAFRLYHMNRTVSLTLDEVGICVGRLQDGSKLSKERTRQLINHVCSVIRKAGQTTELLEYYHSPFDDCMKDVERSTGYGRKETDNGC